jgi:hypothetical protein
MAVDMLSANAGAGVERTIKKAAIRLIFLNMVEVYLSPEGLSMPGVAIS